MGADSREQNLNTVKMTVYLLSQFLDMIESDASKLSAVISGNGRKKSQWKTADVGDMQWKVERDRGITAVLQLLRLNVHRLWEPPVMEEEFVKYSKLPILGTSCCMNILLV